MALGVGPGDKVSHRLRFTFFATAGAIARLGAIPVFVNIDPATFNIESRAIWPILCTGHDATRVKDDNPGSICSDNARRWTAINEIAPSFRIPVMEDAAQAIGAEYEGRRAGWLRDGADAFSFFPTKNLGACGDSRNHHNRRSRGLAGDTSFDTQRTWQQNALLP